MADEYGVKLNIIDATIKVNNYQKKFIIEKIKNAMGIIRGKTISYA